jgi:DNA-binding NarL/FixJ family response regulator
MARNDPPAVAVIDSVPTYRLGLETALAAAEFTIAVPADVRAWSQNAREAVVVVTLRSSLDEQLLQELHADRPAIPLVAVLSAVDLAAYRDAIVMGAHAAVAWNSETDEIVGVIRAALRGRSVLPTEVVRSLTVNMSSKPRITNEERAWLEQLAKGVRVTHLARQAGYSEREMHRLLQRLYGVLGGGSRSEALVKAARLGLLNP